MPSPHVAYVAKNDISLNDSNGSGFELEKEAAIKGQASCKTTSVVDLLETLPYLLGIIVGGYTLSFQLGQVQFSLIVVHAFTQDDHSVQFWYVPSLRTTGWLSLIHFQVGVFSFLV